jgi:hypothetical protein
LIRFVNACDIALFDLNLTYLAVQFQALLAVDHILCTRSYGVATYSPLARHEPHLVRSALALTQRRLLIESRLERQNSCHDLEGHVTMAAFAVVLSLAVVGRVQPPPALGASPEACSRMMLSAGGET